MKTIMSHMARLAKTTGLAILLSPLVVTLPARAAASDDAWVLDSNTSAARLFLGSGQNPNSENVGVARVTGIVHLDENHLNQSVVDVSIYPADEDWPKSLNPEGDVSSGFIPDNTDHTLLTFKSNRISKARDGQLRVTGRLTLTGVERTITADPSEGYAGPTYSDPVIHTVTHEITLLLQAPSATRASGLLNRAVRERRTVQDVSALTHVSHEDFRELTTAIAKTNWPPVVANESCQSPSTAGEGYFGAVCTGAVIAAISADNCQMPLAVGEDFHGAVCTPPAGDQMTIALKLRLIHPKSQQPAEPLPGDGLAQ
jgi:polyisoprenoid-binding protein YceI